MTDYTTLTVQERDKEVFEKACELVGEELGEEPTRSQALRELSEAYVGRDACGGWKHD